MKRLVVVIGILACLVAAPWGARGEPAATATFNFKGARGSDALRLIASQFGYSVVMGDGVGGALTANLNQVTLEQALEYVSQATGCEYVLRDRIVLVNPSALASRVIALRYLSATAAAQAVSKMLSDRGTVEPFTGVAEKEVTTEGAMSNTLIVTDTPARLERVAKVIEAM